MKVKTKLYKIFNIFKWKIVIKIPDFLNPWEYNTDNTIIFIKPPSKNDIVHLRYKK